MEFQKVRHFSAWKTTEGNSFNHIGVVSNVQYV